MDDKSLKEFIELHDVDKEGEVVTYQKLFYKLDSLMKKLHDMGYAISSFDVENILVEPVKFNSVREDKENLYVHDNIRELASIAIKIYGSDSKTFKELEKVTVTRDNYELFREFIPSSVEPYYRGIILRDATVYLSDFMKAKRDREIAEGNRELQSGRAIKKSTMAGKLYSEDENKNAAFTLVYLLPAVVIFLAILIPILIIISR